MLTLKKLLLSCCYLGGVGLLFGQPFRPTEHEHPAMGTLFRFVIYCQDNEKVEASLEMAFAKIDELEQQMSDYRLESELSRLCANPPVNEAQEISPEFWQVLQFSQELAMASQGAFDPSIGPLSKLWRRAIRQQELPDSARIQEAQHLVNYQWLELLPQNRIRFLREGIQLDLGGVAKGFALDAAAAILEDNGITSYLIDGGGDLLLGAAPPEREGWEISLNQGGALTPQSNVAITSSGATYRYLEWEGKRYSHIIDPRSGWGLSQHRITTVIGPVGMVADGLASALSVLSEEEAERLLIEYPAYRCLSCSDW
ncbi:MAG: FAD:protein FMN transferase [Bacteroidota bacterium]